MQLAGPHVRERERDALGILRVVRVRRVHLQRERRVHKRRPVISGEQVWNNRRAGNLHRDDLVAEERPWVDPKGAPQPPLVHRVGFERPRRDVQRSRGQRAHVDVEVVPALKVIRDQNRTLHDGPTVIDAAANLGGWVRDGVAARGR